MAGEDADPTGSTGRSSTSLCPTLSGFSSTQDWACPSLWAALGGTPDVDFIAGQCEGTRLEGTWIVSHLNGPELALAQALRQRRKRARVAESPDRTESPSSEDLNTEVHTQWRPWQFEPLDTTVHFEPFAPTVDNNRPLSPTEQSLDPTVANTPTSASFMGSRNTLRGINALLMPWLGWHY